MDFLKAILSEDLYKQLEAALNAHNGNEANKDKQIKLANLASGEYVGKGKYDALDATLKSREQELTNANGLIEGLKKSEKGNEALQGKITEYESKMQQLQKQLADTQLDYAIKVGLLEAKALDVDYLTFKLKEKGELALDDNGKVKGWEDKLAALKTQLPTQFETAGKKIIQEHKLPDQLDAGGSAEPKNLAEALRMQYEETAK